jgi:hypothetical protein
MQSKSGMDILIRSYLHSATRVEHADVASDSQVTV